MTGLRVNPAHLPEFRPRRYLANGHLQTIVGNYLPRRGVLPQAEAHLVEVSPSREGGQAASQVLCHCHWQPGPQRASAHTALIVHGLEGSSSSQYVLGNAAKLWAAGCNVIRMNMRNCGNTEHLTPTLYHSGLSGDVRCVLQHFLDLYSLESIALIGYSMGGNLVLKLAGEYGATPPPQLCAIATVSPAVDLGPSADALHRSFNRLYEQKFLRALLRRFRRKVALYPRAYHPGRAIGIGSLREFDDRITAFYSGFSSAEDYYHRAAAARVLHQITVPTLILHALDDPFIVLTPQTRAAIVANPAITLQEAAHGGHCAFLAAPHAAQQYDGYWAEHTLLGFLHRHAKAAAL
ncbi:MAG: alpha/beta fold hydrolase [Acidobacteriota bacterium]|nr:alpha/beta fold hydrolase [Acidobacteriota bacterium]